MDGGVERDASGAQGLRGLSTAKPTAEFVQLSQTRCQIWTAIPQIPARYYNDGGYADCRQKLMSDPIPERCAGDRPASQIRGVGGGGGAGGRGRADIQKHLQHPANAADFESSR